MAAGIADYFNVDPLLIRAAFVGLMVFGGSGLVLYVLAWLLIPVEDTDDSIVDAALIELGLAPGRAFVIVAVLAVFFFWCRASAGESTGVRSRLYVEPRLPRRGALLILGIALLRRGGALAGSRGRRRRRPRARRHAEPSWFARRPHVPRGPLGWYTVAAVLIGVGLLAIIDNASDATVMPGQFFGLTLAIVGIGLVIGSWWGNARLLILPVLLVLPIAWAASYLTVPLEGGTGEQWFAPATTEELAGEYRMVGGRLTLDLRELDAGDEPIRISASIAIGTLSVLLPPEAQLEIESHVAAGGSNVLGSYQSGTDVTERYVRGESGPHFVLDLAAGIGYIFVEEYR